MAVRASEVEYFIAAANRLRFGQRLGLSVAQLEDQYAEIESLHFTTDNPAIRNRCEAILDQRGIARDAEITREPFHDDLVSRVPRIFRNVSSSATALAACTATGTSFATPLVAGMAALWLHSQ